MAGGTHSSYGKNSLIVLLALILIESAIGFAQDRNAGADIRVAAGKAPEHRVALVIGNSAYQTSPLKNPANDARAMAKSLRDLGFEVMHLENMGRTGMRNGIRRFGALLKKDSIALFYFAGHGIQVKGRNFLIPVDADIQIEADVEDQSLDTGYLLTLLEQAGSRLNLVILDACRNNPFARSFRSAASGLAQMEAPSGTLVAFATAPGSVASDGDGENGVYTKHMLQNLLTPNLPVEQMFKQVRIGVSRETQDRQVPWESSSLKGDFTFKEVKVDINTERATAQRAEVGRTAAQQSEVDQKIQQALERQAAQLAAQQQAAGVNTGLQVEISFWESVKNSTEPAEMQAYLDQFPQGRFVALAKSRIKRLQQPAPLLAASTVVATPAVAPQVSAAVTPQPTVQSASARPNPPTLATPAVAPQASRPATPQPAMQPLSAPPIQPTPAPQQARVASLATSTQAATQGALDAKFPKVGDTWVYRYTDGWKPNDAKPTSTRTISGVTEVGILETFHDSSGATDLVFSDEVTVENRTGDLYEFAPYLQAYGLIEIGRTWRFSVLQKNSSEFPWEIIAKAVGRETITVPAGTFNAFKIEMTGTRSVRSNNTSGPSPSMIELNYWYAPEVKRIVKHTMHTYRGYRAGADSKDVYELVSYKLN